MTTLTSALGWTSGASAVKIIAKVTAFNSDGSAAVEVIDANSTNYLFAPTTAPTIALSAKTNAQITMQFTCLPDAQTAGYNTLADIEYYLEYKAQISNTWIAHTVLTGCPTTSTTTVTGLSEVTTYEFRAYAKSIIGQGPTSQVANYQTVITYGKPG
jgi:hypothetical protein